MNRKVEFISPILFFVTHPFALDFLVLKTSQSSVLNLPNLFILVMGIYFKMC